MKVFNHFRTRGGYECFDQNTQACKMKEKEISDQQNLSFNNFEYDDGDTNEDTMDLSAEMQMNSTMNTTQENALNDGNESELQAIEEDGTLTGTSLGILGIIIFSLTAYVLYWFCCSNTSKGYRQHSGVIMTTTLTLRTMRRGIDKNKFMMIGPMEMRSATRIKRIRIGVKTNNWVWWMIIRVMLRCQRVIRRVNGKRKRRKKRIQNTM